MYIYTNINIYVGEAGLPPVASVTLLHDFICIYMYVYRNINIYVGEAGLPPVASVTLLYDFHTDKPDDTGKGLDAPLAALLRAAHPADKKKKRGPGDGRHTREFERGEKKADGDGRQTRQADTGDVKVDAPGPGMSGKDPGDGGASDRGGRRRDVVTLLLID